MIGPALLILPILGIILFDPIPPDWFAVKYVVLLIGAATCLLLALLPSRLAGLLPGVLPSLLPGPRRREIVRSPVDLALWIFVAVRGVMLLNSPLGGEQVRWWALLFLLAILHQLAQATPERRWLRRNAARGLALLAGIVAMTAVIQRLSGAPQANAFFANRTFAGVGLAMLLPFVLTVRWPVLLRGPLLTLGLLGLLAIGSRTGALAAAAALATVVAWRWGRWRWLVPLGLALPVLAAGIALGESDTIKVRLHWYGAAWQMGTEKPLLGQGAGGFEREYPPRRSLEEHAISGGRRVHAVHNDYLESWADGGALGLLAHLFLVVGVFEALRRRRDAAAALLAFGVGSLTDLPLRDPSLLALAMLLLSFGPRRARIRNGVRPALALSAAVAIAATLPALRHWQADRVFGAYLADRDRAGLDRVLDLERDHPGALIERSSPEDLRRLIRLRPHDADALYNSTRDLPREEAIVKLQLILDEHDRFHGLTLVRLAQLVRKDDAVHAVSLLRRAIDADPRPWRPHAELARTMRESGDWRSAERALERVRGTNASIALERVRIELERLRETGRVGPAFERAAERSDPVELASIADETLAIAAGIKAQSPPPRLEARPGEDPVSYARRIRRARARRDRELDPKLRPHYHAALLLGRALVRRQPSTRHLRLLAEAARGMDLRTEADEAEGTAFFLDALLSLAEGDRGKARFDLKRALRAHPGWARSETFPSAVRLFIEKNPQIRADARWLFKPYPPLLAACD